MKKTLLILVLSFTVFLTGGITNATDVCIEDGNVPRGPNNEILIDTCFCRQVNEDGKNNVRWYILYKEKPTDLDIDAKEKEVRYCIQFQEKLGRTKAITGDNGVSLISNTISTIYRYAIAIIGIFAVLIIVISGASLIFGGLNEELVSSAKKRIMQAILSIVILLLSNVILRTVNPGFFTAQEKTEIVQIEPSIVFELAKRNIDIIDDPESFGDIALQTGGTDLSDGESIPGRISFPREDNTGVKTVGLAARTSIGSSELSTADIEIQIFNDPGRNINVPKEQRLIIDKDGNISLVDVDPESGGTTNERFIHASSPTNINAVNSSAVIEEESEEPYVAPPSASAPYQELYDRFESEIKVDYSNIPGSEKGEALRKNTELFGTILFEDFPNLLPFFGLNTSMDPLAPYYDPQVPNRRHRKEVVRVAQDFLNKNMAVWEDLNGDDPYLQREIVENGYMSAHMKTVILEHLRILILHYDSEENNSESSNSSESENE